MSVGLRPRDLQRHPVTEVLSHAALGEIPTEEGLDALRLPADARRQLHDAAVVAAATKASGENAEARRLGNRAAEEIVQALPEEMRDPDFFKEPAPDITDPRELAAQVPRR